MFLYIYIETFGNKWDSNKILPYWHSTDEVKSAVFQFEDESGLKYIYINSVVVMICLCNNH